MTTLHRLMRSLIAAQPKPHVRTRPAPGAKLAQAEARHTVLRKQKTCCF